MPRALALWRHACTIPRPDAGGPGYICIYQSRADGARRHQASGLGCLMFACSRFYRCRDAQACFEQCLHSAQSIDAHTTSAPSHLELSIGVLVVLGLRNRLDLPCRVPKFLRLRRGRSGRGGQASFLSITRPDLRITPYLSITPDLTSESLFHRLPSEWRLSKNPHGPRPWLRP